jgi:ribonuclease J
LGEATHRIIELNNLFTPQNLTIAKTNFFQNQTKFQIGDISITPYWADHSAFDAYSFLIEADGKSIFYSGDFRGHGRKSKVFKWFTHNPPEKVDYLLLEGTTIGRADHNHKTEDEIEQELVDLFKQSEKFHCIYSSGQNVDRLVSIYKACLRTDKLMVVDVYIATVLKELSKYAKIPYPSENYSNLKVFYPYYTSKRLSKEGNKNILYQFKKFKITKEEIDKQHEKIVMLVRPSMKKDLEKINNIDGGVFIYSMWEGYLKKPEVKKFIDYLKGRNFTLENIHTSGHADPNTLNKLVDSLNPDYIVPIHTFKGDLYKNIFNFPIVEMKDGEIKQI